MKILMVNYEYPPLGGGGGVFNKQVAEELGKDNEITVITSNFDNQNPHETINNVEVIRVPVLMRKDQNIASLISMISFFPVSFWSGYKLLKRRRFDIIHSFFSIPSAPSGLLLSKQFHRPHLLSIMGGDIYDPSKKLSPHKTPILCQVVKKTLEISDKVVALSNDIKQKAFDYYCPSKKIDVIHLGIPKPLFTKRSREQYSFKPDDILLITVGRVVLRKALHELFYIVKMLQPMNIKLLVVGDGPEKDKLKTLTVSLGLSDNIFFLGNTSDEEKFQFLNISDIYVSTSQHEGFGIVFLEAMALALPVVCYDEGGQTDFLINGKTGFTVKINDRAAFAEKIKMLYKNFELRNKMCEFNRKYIERYYITSCAEKYRFQYKMLIEKTV
tara:strand:+ start:7992 stop:9146 length:1155 start_codon:yes stop_codon:yes gene_type:complete